MTAVVAALATSLTPTAANAGTTESEQTVRDELVVLFESVAPGFLDRSGDASDQRRTPAFTPAADNEPIALPSEAAEAVLVGTARVGLAPQETADLGDALQLQSNAVAFVGPDTTQVAVDRGAGQYALATVIQTEQAADRIAYDLQSTTDLQVELGESGGALFLDGDKVVGGAFAPWAVDANGAEVPTSYVIEDGVLVQVVDHVGGGFTYPIVADPTYYGESLIDRVVTRTVTKGRELSVYTSSWWATALFGPGNYVVRAQVTDEFARITPSPWDTTGARQQVSCHAYNAPLKNPWNIELWRPTVGEAATVLAACNPS